LILKSVNFFDVFFNQRLRGDNSFSHPNMQMKLNSHKRRRGPTAAGLRNTRPRKLCVAPEGRASRLARYRAAFSGRPGRLPADTRVWIQALEDPLLPHCGIPGGFPVELRGFCFEKPQRNNMLWNPGSALAGTELTTLRHFRVPAHSLN
jgi:hypothetical protein